MALLEDSGRCLALEDEGGSVINLCSPTSPYFTCWLHSDHHIDSTYNNWNGQTNKQYTRFTIPCHQYKYKPCLSFASASSKSIEILMKQDPLLPVRRRRQQLYLTGNKSRFYFDSQTFQFQIQHKHQ